MRVCLMGEWSSIHLQKWVRSLSALERMDISVITFRAGTQVDGVAFYYLKRYTGTRLDYFLNIGRVRSFLKTIGPDLLHAHYATSYGLLGALSGFHPFILSVWGSDVFDFPTQSPLNRKMLIYNLKKADRILSTSHVMAEQTHKYTDKEIEVTPFGIDLDQFKRLEVDSIFDGSPVVIGTIKALEKKYGIEYLILGFDMVRQRHPDMDLRLLIVGKGSQEEELKALTRKLGIDGITKFTGAIDHTEVPAYHNQLDIYVALSRLKSESFGVAIIEASACERPVLVSKVGGLPEVVDNNVTGFVVPADDMQQIADKLDRLVTDPDLRQRMGYAGRERVKELYEWGRCVEQMAGIYHHVKQEEI